MADNYAFGGGTARSKDENGKHVPYTYVATGRPTVVDMQNLTVGTTGGTLASFCSGAALPSGATHALVQAAKANAGKVYWSDSSGDAANAGSNFGFELSAGDTAELVELAAVTLDADTASQVLHVSFRRYDQ